jgi:hypothetical protein
MDFLKSIAPWLAAAATGGVPALVGMAANELTNVLGFEVAPDAKAIEKATAGATAEQLLAIKQADQAFAVKMQELGYGHIEKLEALAVENVKDARANNVAGEITKPLLLISTLLLIATIGANVFVLIEGIPDGINDALATRAIGFLENITMMVLGYWFGTSHGSLMKTNLMGVK